MKVYLNAIIYFLTTYILIALSGCATTSGTTISAPPGVPGIYHQIQRNETLWCISQQYGIDMKEIMKVNKLRDATNVKAGQLILIPSIRQRSQSAHLFTKGESFIWPVRGEIISSFGLLVDGAKNKGIDIAAQEGANVIAARSGTVSFCDDKVKGFGKTIILDHNDGYSTVYAYNSDILVKPGDYVNRGNTIAKIGRTGRAKAASLHFEIRKKHKPENPSYFLP